MPLLLFVILFGLSMDYHVFILSRIREAFDRGASMDEAVAHGIKSTAGVVTSAAIVMVAVFSVFAALSILFFKQFGVGLAAAILIDATIVRGVLLPATMKLLGDWNWYLPAWLEWLPHLEQEEPPTDRPANSRSHVDDRRRTPARPAGDAQRAGHTTRTRLRQHARPLLLGHRSFDRGEHRDRVHLFDQRSTTRTNGRVGSSAKASSGVTPMAPRLRARTLTS